MVTLVVGRIHFDFGLINLKTGIICSIYSFVADVEVIIPSALNFKGPVITLESNWVGEHDVFHR